MKKILLLGLLILWGVLSLHAQPYLVTATNYASGFFGVVADENGQPLSVSSTIHLIWDAAGDGMDPPSTVPGYIGLPTGDDVLMGVAQVGITGGAPSAGTFILPGTTTASDGWCYLRAFHAAVPIQGTFYSQSLTQYALPPMAAPVIYGIQFPAEMISTLGSIPAIIVDAIPQAPPINIGPGGGSFQYTLELHNTTTASVMYDLWIDAILPNGSTYGPILVRSNLNMPGEATWTRQMTQAIPAGAPPGIYTYMAHAGDVENGTIIHEDGFPFEKLGAGGVDGLSSDRSGWETTGWEEGENFSAAIPNVFFLAPPYPNPFNPTAQIQFGLPRDAQVQIDIYNILGSRVTTLMNGTLNAGYHKVIWEAGNYTSGLYLVQMKAGGFVHTEKALLVK